MDFPPDWYKAFVPHHSVDCVIFGFHAGELKILLLKWKQIHAWSLPGGFIKQDESLDDAAHRILQERTGLDEIYLQQFYTFGGLSRRERALDVVMKDMAGTAAEDFWITRRVISTGYYALVDFSTVTPEPDFFSKACTWCDIHSRPPLLFDHDGMVERALRTLRTQMGHQPIGFNLMPETFTMPELQNLYETVLSKTLDRRNFQKKMLAFGMLERVGERKNGRAHKSPYLYRFDKARYDAAVGEGLWPRL